MYNQVKKKLLDKLNTLDKIRITKKYYLQVIQSLKSINLNQNDLIPEDVAVVAGSSCAAAVGLQPDVCKAVVVVVAAAVVGDASRAAAAGPWLAAGVEEPRPGSDSAELGCDKRCTVVVGQAVGDTGHSCLVVVEHVVAVVAHVVAVVHVVAVAQVELLGQVEVGAAFVPALQVDDCSQLKVG